MWLVAIVLDITGLDFLIKSSENIGTCRFKKAGPLSKYENTSFIYKMVNLFG
jgi:hypothetical protein